MEKANIEIHNEDSRVFFKNFDRKEGDVIITDPPFNIGFHYETYKDNLPKKEWLDMLSEVCKPPCVLILYPEMMFEFSNKIGVFPDKCVSWVFPSNLPRQHRMIAWFGVKPDFTKVQQPYKNRNISKIKKRIAEGKEAKLYDWWEINMVKNTAHAKTDHPCQMPFEVMSRIVGITPCDRVIEPFAGSGTTLVAAKEWNIDAVGVEMNPNYCNIINDRLKQELLF